MWLRLFIFEEARMGENSCHSGMWLRLLISDVAVRAPETTGDGFVRAISMALPGAGQRFTTRWPLSAGLILSACKSMSGGVSS
jgi:hypothetical protein